MQKVLSIVSEVLLTTLICPSVWGWQVVENNNLVPNLAHKVSKNDSRI